MWTREAGLIGALGLGAVALSFAAAPGWQGAAGASLALLVLAIAAIDRRRQIIPDSLNALAYLGGLAAAALHSDSLGSALQAVIRAAVMAALFLAFRAAYRSLRGVEGMGLGDVKLAGVAGAWLGWPLLPLAVEIAALSALAVVFVGRVRGRSYEYWTRLPFGTFFAPAIWICWAIGAWRGDWTAP